MQNKRLTKEFTRNLIILRSLSISFERRKTFLQHFTENFTQTMPQRFPSYLISSAHTEWKQNRRRSVSSIGDCESRRKLGRIWGENFVLSLYSIREAPKKVEIKSFPSVLPAKRENQFHGYFFTLSNSDFLRAYERKKYCEIKLRRSANWQFGDYFWGFWLLRRSC